LPARTGLGSSSSFTVGLLHALYGLKGIMPNKMRLAREAIHVEQERLKENVGSQDQVMAAFGGFNRVNFDPNGEIRVAPILLERQRLRDLQDHLMLIYTGLSRTASDIAGEQIKATRSREKEQELRAMHQMVEEGIRILQGGQGLEGFGRLLHESWKLKRSLTDRVSTPKVDEIYAAALRHGATGGKLLGAGGGGFVLLFVPPENQEAVRQGLDGLLQVPVEFESDGSRIIFYDVEDESAVKSPVLNEAVSPRG
jgi:D-glycero-alpha-D-manno-heptose-7-phosphate kinase